MIGIFDSGLGGLTALKEVRRLIPGEDIVYFGDTGRVPYGSRSRETIIKYALQDMNFLMSKKVDAVLIACGTVSSTAIGVIRAEYPETPILGVVDSAAREAVRITGNKKIGVIATATTIGSGAFRKKLLEADPGVQVYETACPLFVPLVENGFISDDDEVVRLVAERYLADIKASGADTLILGCTHYPIITGVISKAPSRSENSELIKGGGGRPREKAVTVGEKERNRRILRQRRAIRLREDSLDLPRDEARRQSRHKNRYRKILRKTGMPVRKEQEKMSDTLHELYPKFPKNFPLPMLLDASTGTSLMRDGMPAGSCTEKWVLDHPDVLKSIQTSYEENGSDALYTPTFGANRPTLAREGFDNPDEMNRELASLSVGKAKFTGGDMSPTGLFIEPFGDTPFDEVVAVYREQAKVLDEAGRRLFHSGDEHKPSGGARGGDRHTRGVRQADIRHDDGRQ